MMTGVMPEGALESIAGEAGIDADSVTGILKEAAPSVLGSVAKSAEGDSSFVDKALGMVSGGGDGVLSMLMGSQIVNLIAPIAKKFGISSSIVTMVVSKALPFVLEQMKSGKITPEMLKAAAGLADGVGLDDVQNIAGAVLGKKGGIMGTIGGLFGKK